MSPNPNPSTKFTNFLLNSPFKSVLTGLPGLINVWECVDPIIVVGARFNINVQLTVQKIIRAQSLVTNFLCSTYCECQLATTNSFLSSFYVVIVTHFCGFQVLLNYSFIGMITITEECTCITGHCAHQEYAVEERGRVSYTVYCCANALQINPYTLVNCSILLKPPCS